MRLPTQTLGRRLILPPAPTTDVGSFTPLNLGTSSILPYCRQSGDNAYEIPDGTYTGGDLLDAAHPATGGRYNGYLLLKPQTLGGGVIDCSYPGKNLGGGLTAAGDLNINYSRTDAQAFTTHGTSSGIIFVGFKVLNGIAQCNAPDVWWWYPECTFPFSAWSAEPSYPSGNYHRENGGLYFGFGAVGGAYGANVHDAGTGPTIQQDVSDISIIGMKLIRLDNGGNYDNVHPDAIQMLGGNNHRITISDCDLQPTVKGFGPNFQNGATNHQGKNSDNIHVARVWVHNAAELGWQANSFLSSSGAVRILSGDFTDCHFWNNGTAHGGQNSAGWQWAEGIEGGGQITYTMGDNPAPDKVLFTATRSDTLVAQTGTDPATAWQGTAGQGYADVFTFFAARGWAR